MWSSVVPEKDLTLESKLVNARPPHRTWPQTQTMEQGVCHTALERQCAKQNAKRSAQATSHCDLAIYIKKYLKAKEELWKLKFFTIQKYNLPKIL
jgi:hypothetical protein